MWTCWEELALTAEIPPTFQVTCSKASTRQGWSLFWLSRLNFVRHIFALVWRIIFFGDSLAGKWLDAHVRGPLAHLIKTLQVRWGFTCRSDAILQASHHEDMMEFGERINLTAKLLKNSYVTKPLLPVLLDDENHQGRLFKVKVLRPPPRILNQKPFQGGAHDCKLDHQGGRSEKTFQGLSMWEMGKDAAACLRPWPWLCSTGW